MQIEVRNLSKIFRESRKSLSAIRQASPQNNLRKGLESVSFQVAQGELIAIVGHNGAGKSTLLKMLAGWMLPDEGQVNLAGLNLADRKALANLVGFAAEVPNLFEFFSVEYNLKLFAWLFYLPSSRVEEILRDFNLAPFRKSKVYVYRFALIQAP